MVDPKELKEFEAGIAPAFLRDLFACAAMKVILSKHPDDEPTDYEGVALSAYEVAERMLWARGVSAKEDRVWEAEEHPDEEFHWKVCDGCGRQCSCQLVTDGKYQCTWCRQWTTVPGAEGEP